VFAGLRAFGTELDSPVRQAVVPDVTIVNLALPAIERGLNFSQSDLRWAINA
jgi:hypothetical protein